MIDIETMGTGPDAAILTIGAVMFDPRAEDTEETLRPESTLFGPITFKSNAEEGRAFDPDTIAWWMTQSKEAQLALVEGKQINLRGALEQFRQWIAGAKPAPTRVWGNDPDFDCVILIHAFKRAGLMWPFKFWESRSVRTIKELAYPPGGLRGDFPAIGVGTAHNAQDDTIRQALAVQHAYKILDA
jgi:hypothetical protein